MIKEKISSISFLSFGEDLTRIFRQKPVETDHLRVRLFGKAEYDEKQ